MTWRFFLLIYRRQREESKSLKTLGNWKARLFSCRWIFDFEDLILRNENPHNGEHGPLARGELDRGGDEYFVFCLILIFFLFHRMTLTGNANGLTLILC